MSSFTILKEDFLFSDLAFSKLFAIHRKDNFAFGEGATAGIPATIHPRLRLSACLIFHIYRPWGNNVPPEISMTVGVYGYDVSMEIKHFRAPRKMHTFPLANPSNLPPRSLPIPPRHQLVSKNRQLHAIWCTIKTTREGSRYAPSRSSERW
jgi:hypothetical protein